MKLNIDYKSFTEGNYHIILYNLLVALIANLTIVFVIAYITIENIQKEIGHHIDWHNGENGNKEVINMAYFCKEYKCKHVFFNNNLYKNNSNNLLTECNEDLYDITAYFRFSDNGYITKNFNIYVDLTEEIQGFMIVDASYFLRAVDTQATIILLIFAVLNISLLLVGLRGNNMNKYRHDRKRESALYTQSLIILTENLHHELNTPLAVIDNKIAKIKKYVMPHEINKNTRDILGHDFRLVKSSVDQITDILNKMKKFKVLKRGGNICIYNVIETTFNVLLVTQAEKVSFEIDPALKDFKINDKYIRNGELTSIILNLIKNSVEAQSTSIKISTDTPPKLNSGKINIYVADNGNGIPHNNKKKIFEENFSTKIKGKVGNGLFVSKFLLEADGGSIKLIDTSPSGTIIRITVPATILLVEGQEKSKTKECSG